MRLARISLVATLSAAALAAGCARAPKQAEIVRAKHVPAGWQWEVPTPMPPPMAWVPAGHFRKEERTVASVDTVTIHTTEGGFKEERTHAENQIANFTGVINYFKKNDRSVSAHFVMGPNGEICSMVDEADTAHTQTYYNSRAFGIECAGWSSRPETWTPELLDSLVDLTAYLCVKWEIPAYHPVGTAWEGPNSIVTEEGQFRYNGIGLVGHFQVQPWNKSDPGSHFPWDDFAERVRARIREHGIEPIELPATRPELPAGSSVTATLVPDVVTPGQTHVYTFTVQAPGAGSIPENDVVFADPAKEFQTQVTASAPKRVEAAGDRLVYEVTLTPAGTRGFAAISPKVKIGGNWYDAGTLRAKSEPKPEEPKKAE